MRRVLMATLSALILAVLTITAVLLSSTTESAPTTVVLPTPSATPALPVCVTEDGAGQALCIWDGKVQGNGMGERIISGDCAPSVMGNASEVCINLHSRPTITTMNEDGSMTVVVGGPDLIAECQAEFGTVLELQECVKAWHRN